MVGATHLRIMPPDADGTIGLQIDYGRVVLMSSGMAGARVRLGLGNEVATLTFDDADATAAVEVLPHLDPGADPSTAPLSRSAHLYVASGTVTLGGESGDSETLTAPVRVALNERAETEASASDEMPDWIFSNAYIKQLDQNAAQVIHNTLAEGGPLLPALTELAEHRRVEVRSLAARQLTYLDDFDAVIGALDNEQLRASWPAYFDALRHAVARNQGSSQKVLLALEKRYGKQAAEMHRMLWGYTKDQLTGGRAAELVGYLDNDELAFRVLSYLNLEEITGKGGGYQPQHNALRRRRAVSSWRERYENGEIIPLEGATAASDDEP
ncbi:MAG: hypothetical protein R3C10_02695 [Pirellulales bacterium]